MYSSYSTLQRKQLTKQVYTDTQSTYLLVYAPGRHQALEHALENQLHRKFRLVTELAPALTDSVEGVLLVSEDVECTSTALTYFAAALRTGADLVVCDAAVRLRWLQRPVSEHPAHPVQPLRHAIARSFWTACRAAARGRDRRDRSCCGWPTAMAQKLPLRPAVIAALPAGAVCRGRILCRRKACFDAEPRADHDRCAHRADKCRAGAAQHWL